MASFAHNYDRAATPEPPEGYEHVHTAMRRAGVTETHSVVMTVPITGGVMFAPVRADGHVWYEYYDTCASQWYDYPRASR